MMTTYDSLAEFGKRCGGISRQAVSAAVKRGTILAGTRGIDPNIPENRAYIESSLERKRTGNRSEVAPPAKKKPTKPRKPQKGNDNSTNGPINGSGQLDIEYLSRTDAERLKIIEQVFNYQIKTQKERQELIERALVKRVWAKLYAVDTAELHPLGEKISADLAAMFGSDDNEAKLKAKNLVDRHVFKALEHIKRLMDDFLKKVGEEEI